MPDLRVTLGSLVLTTPVLAAAGTVGYGMEFARAIRFERLGAPVTKTLTRQPRDGNAPPRLVETPSGMLNAVGLRNCGLDNNGRHHAAEEVAISRQSLLHLEERCVVRRLQATS